MTTRHELRERIFKILFQLDNTDLKIEDILELNENDSEYVESVVANILEKKEEIDLVISENLKDWKLERLSKMDRQILRIATYEIIFSDIPYKVSINEAIELSKKYSEKDSSYKFINGVLKGIVASGKYE